MRKKMPTTIPVKRRKTATQIAATTTTTQPEPRPVYLIKSQENGYSAKYGRFEGFGKTQKQALDELLYNMYVVISNVVE